MIARDIWLERISLLILGLVIVIDGILFIYVRYNLDSFAKDTSLLYRAGRESSPAQDPIGYTSTGAKIVPATKGGLAVRFASKDCQFSRADAANWNAISSEFHRRGYDVIIVVTKVEEQYPSDAPELKAAHQEAYVDMGWIERFRLTLTPTLLIFAPSKQLMWAHQGALRAEDVSSAERAMDAYK